MPAQPEVSPAWPLHGSGRMPQSFTATRAVVPSESTQHRRVLVTGAAGNIGSYFAEHSHAKYDLRLMVHGNEQRIDAIRIFGEVVEADLGDLERLKQICQGIDTVLHLAADASAEATWESLHPTNIVGTYNVFVAARS